MVHLFRRAPRPTEPSPTRRQQAVRLERAGDWSRASRSWAEVVAGAPAVVDHQFRWGRSLARNGHLDQARSVFAAALTLDPTVPPFAGAMLEANVAHFLPRLDLARWVWQHRPEIEDRADALPQTTTCTLPEPVFIYWGQGLSDAPPVVAACVASARRALGAERVTVLDDQSWPRLLELTAGTRRVQSIDRTRFSDILRINLLRCYGGTWLDATTLVTTAARQPLTAHQSEPFVAYRRRGELLSSWYLSATAGGRLTRLLSAALDLHWDGRERPGNYFAFHHLFEALTRADPECGRIWSAAPALSCDPPHRLRRRLEEPVTEVDLDGLLDASPVHKLSHRVSSPSGQPGSVLEAVLRRYPPH